MNRNAYYYKPYDKINKNHNKNKSNKNLNNNNFMNNNKNHYNKNYTAPYQRNSNYENGYEMPQSVNQKYWKRKTKCGNWTKMPKPIKAPTVNCNENQSTDVFPPKWNQADAIQAIEVERECNKLQSSQYILRFPDPFIDKSIIHKYSSSIVDVRVQQPITPRFVYIQVRPDTNYETLKEEFSQIKFGTGFLRLEKRSVPTIDHLAPEDIDPYTIFMGNIHPSTPIQSIKQSVQKAYRVDVGFAKKHKFGRYAFAKFRTAKDAREAFMTLRSTSNTGGMDMVVRFRRLRGNISNGPNNQEKQVHNAKKAVNDTTTEVIDITDDDDEIDDLEKIATQTEKPITIKIEKDQSDEVKDNLSSIEAVAGSLLTNDILDWDKLRLLEINRYESKPDISKLPVFNFASNICETNNDWDDLFNQLDPDFNSVFEDGLDLY
uniref:CSON008695 protein n=1 Tax=Culicoides sonorensis TaxID=179676 RepID=A0A336N069_CULSO